MKYSFIALLVILSLAGRAQQPAELQSFRLQEVQLLPGMFKDAETTDLRYMMEMVPDRLLAPYLREAGLKPKAESYTNWENTGLDGHMGGHYLSALAMMYASTGNKQVLERLNYMISELKRCQDANGNGYIGGVPGSKELWASVIKGDVGAIKKKWVPFYNLHKTFAGIRDAYLYTGDPAARQMFIKFADWFVMIAASVTPEQMQEMLKTEQGGINEVLADTYALTGDKKYLKAAYSFSHQAILKPLEQGQDRLNSLHANTQIPKVIGFKRIADVGGDTAYNQAARFFWETVVDHRTIAIGGNSVSEHFNPASDFSSMVSNIEGPETCNTYNMLKLTKALYLSDPRVSYMDYYERALYNHILSSERPGKGGFVYFTPMRPGHYRIYSQPQTSMWCCVGTGIENHAKYAEMIYAHDQHNLFVNLFIPSRLNWKQKGLVLTQHTAFPEAEKTSFTINKVRAGSTFTLRVRYPAWVRAGALKVAVNGKAVKITAQPSTYAGIKRTWKKGDVVTVSLPMQTTTERLPDGSNYEAVLHGPIVMAAPLGNQDIPGLLADDSRMGHIPSGKILPLDQMPMFVSNDRDDAAFIKSVTGQPLTFIAADLMYPAKYSGLKLVPFYKIHDERYVVYFERETSESIIPIQKKLAAEEAAAAKLAAMTIDVVTAGEQQPESDHFMESDNSTTGVIRARHFRAATGWFAYQLSDKRNEAGSLRVTYFGRDRSKKFSISVNDRVISQVSLEEGHGNEFYTADYAVPDDLLRSSSGTLTVKFTAAGPSATANIFEVRLLRK